MPRVLLDHDAHVDDLLVLLLLIADGRCELAAQTVCAGDCFPGPGLRAARRFAAFLGAGGLPAAAGADAGVNPFPDLWRSDSRRLAALAELGSAEPPGPDPAEAAPELIARTLRAAGTARMIATGPLTNLAEAFAGDASLAERVERLWVMGVCRRGPRAARGASAPAVPRLRSSRTGREPR